MLSVLRASVLAAAALILISQAKAEDAPADTQRSSPCALLNFEVCRNKVLDGQQLQLHPNDGRAARLHLSAYTSRDPRGFHCGDKCNR